MQNHITSDQIITAVGGGFLEITLKKKFLKTYGKKKNKKKTNENLAFHHLGMSKEYGAPRLDMLKICFDDCKKYKNYRKFFSVTQFVG